MKDERGLARLNVAFAYACQLTVLAMYALRVRSVFTWGGTGACWALIFLALGVLHETVPLSGWLSIVDAKYVWTPILQLGLYHVLRIIFFNSLRYEPAWTLFDPRPEAGNLRERIFGGTYVFTGLVLATIV
jgi:hypothetical protein